MSLKYRGFLRRLMHLQSKVKYRPVPIIRCKKYDRNNFTLPCSLGFSILTLLGLEKKMSAEDELIHTIKHCILFINRGEYDKAEQLLHIALRNAQQINHQLGITYIYDVMANLALETEQYNKARELFVAVAQRIMADGATEDDLRMIHISAKLARISHMQNQHTTAQLGFEWCLEKLNNNFSQNPSEEVNKLLALIEDWYGRLYLDSNQYKHGLEFLTRAYNRMKNIPDFEQEHLVIQLNDIGTLYYRIGDIDDSINYFKQAIELGTELPEMHDLGAFHVNLGRAYMKKNLIDQARKSCGYGWKLGVIVKNKDVKEEATKCLEEIKNLK